MQAEHNLRRFSDVYSAAGQRERFDAGWSHDDFLAHLRVDALLAETIILPDTYLFDGAYFLDADPEDLRIRVGREITGRQLPIVVRTRRSTLKESLRGFLLRDGSPFLNRFPFNAIKDEAARNALADALAAFPPDEYQRRLREDVPRDLARLLRELLERSGHEADADIDQMHAGWSKWLATEHAPESNRRLKVSKWNRDLDVREVATDDRYRIQPDNHLETPAGRTLHEEVLGTIESGRTYRADASRRFREEKKLMTRPDEARDLNTIRSWYDDTRHRAIARQHDCTAFAYTPNPSAKPIGPLQRREREIATDGARESTEVTVPEDFYYRLLSVDPEPYAKVMLKVMPHLRAWWNTGHVEALQRVMDDLLPVANQASGIEKRAQGIIEVLGNLVAGFPVVGPVMSTLVSRSASGAIAAESSRRVVEYLIDAHPSEKP
jgi:hypothetical protein